MQKLINEILDLFFPPRCAGCRRRGALLCAACRAACRFVPDMANQEQHRRLASPFLASTAGAYIFDGPIREAIHALKYDGQTRVAVPLGELLACYLALHPLAADGIVPVPLHPDRLRMRGYNQAQLLARQLAQQTGMPLLDDHVVRVRHTSQQADLNRAERRENVVNAFAWRSTRRLPPRILVIDDVLTTGATVEAVAKALQGSGARTIYALALARGL